MSVVSDQLRAERLTAGRGSLECGSPQRSMSIGEHEL